MTDLSKLKAGDEVAHWYSYNAPTISIVDRVTPSGRIHIGTQKFNSHGRLIGGRSGGFIRTHITELTPEIRDRIWREERITVLRHHTDWSKLPTNALKAISAIIEAHKEKPPEPTVPPNQMEMD